MEKQTVVFFRPYPFICGQKIHIQEGPRRGDWEVRAVTERKVTLRCPVTGKILEADRFCYFVKEDQVDAWPGE
jgi:hypothetical protein